MMKKLILFFIAVVSLSFCFAESYTQNVYQKMANEYTRKAEKAFDAGEYDKAVEYSQKAEENAALSEAFIKMMLARAEADKQMKTAKARLDFCESIHGDRNFPMAYNAGKEAYASAESSYAAEKYDEAASYAKQAVEALAGIHEVTPLPQFYVVRPWAETKDCYWNISGRPYIYNNPLLWENLYEANRGLMPRPDNPNLILPGMKMEIPSLSGEYREGVYNSSKKYEPYSSSSGTVKAAE